MKQPKNNQQQTLATKAELISKAMQEKNPVLKKAMLDKARQIGKKIEK